MRRETKNRLWRIVYTLGLDTFEGWCLAMMLATIGLGLVVGVARNVAGVLR